MRGRIKNTYERGTISKISSSHTVNLNLVLDGHHLLDEGGSDRIAEVSQHQRDGIRGLGRDQEFAVTPRTTPQERPEFGVVLPLHTDRCKIAIHGIVYLGGVDKEDGAIESDEKIGMEERVVRDIRATKVEGIRWKNLSQKASRVSKQISANSPIWGKDTTKVPTCLWISVGSALE